MDEIQEGITAHLGNLKRFARSLVGYGHDHEADDLVQSCVLRALEKADHYQSGTNLRAWLFRIMRNQFISDCRHRQICRRHAARVLQGPLHSEPSQEHQVLLREVVEVLGQMPAVDIEHIMELGVGEKSHEDVAARYRVPIGTVKSRLFRSRAKLRTRMNLDDDKRSAMN